jgi:hypothetical protein
MWPIWILITILALLGHVTATDINHAYHSYHAIKVNPDVPENCDPGFFEMTEKNLEESKSDEFYRQFIIEEAKEHPDEYTRLGEVSFFARYAFNGFEVHCGSYENGCSGIPTCPDILSHVHLHGGDKHRARQIYFSIKKVEHIVGLIFWFYVSLWLKTLRRMNLTTSRGS